MENQTKSPIEIITENYNRLEKELIQIQKENENLKQHLKEKFPNTVYSSIDLKPYENSDSAQYLEVLAGRFGAFRPMRVSILCRRKTQESGVFEKECSADLLSVTIMGAPQFGNFFSDCYYSDTKFFENGKNVNWGVFGNSLGQGLGFKIRNPHNFCVSVSVMVDGYGANTSMIGSE
jgi:hypothetical protein